MAAFPRNKSYTRLSMSSHIIVFGLVYLTLLSSMGWLGISQMVVDFDKPEIDIGINTDFYNMAAF